MKFKQCSKVDTTSLCENWIALVKSHHHQVYEAEYNQIRNIIDINGCWDGVNNCLNKPIYSCIVDSHGEAWAIVELVKSRSGASVWVKMLNMYLSPKIELESDTAANTKKRLDIFNASLRGIFELTKGIKGADTVKVFGRTDVLIAFLRGMHDSESVITMLGTIDSIQVSIEGRWLVFRTS